MCRCRRAPTGSLRGGSSGGTSVHACRVVMPARRRGTPERRSQARARALRTGLQGVCVGQLRRTGPYGGKAPVRVLGPMLCTALLLVTACDGLIQAAQQAQQERLAMMRGCDAHVPAQCLKLADAEMADYRSGADPGHE